MTPSTSNSVIPLAANSPTGFNSATNRFSTPGIFSFDNGGNLTALKGNTLAYDAEKRLKSVNGLGISETISYDATGRRVQKSLSSGSTAYVDDVIGNLAAEYANGTTWSRDYIRWGGGQLIATENASGPCTTCYLLYDHLGSVRLITDANANVIARHDYLPHGEEIAAGIDGRNSQFGLTTDTTAKFTGQLRDQDAGQDYLNARYFSAALGRFHSPDPGSAGATLADPQTWNGYAYVRNSPLNVIDPSGMSCVQLDGTDSDGEPTFSDNGDGQGCAPAGVAPGILTPDGTPAPGQTSPLDQGQVNAQATADVSGGPDALDYLDFFNLWNSGALPSTINYGPNDGWTKDIVMSSSFRHIRNTYIQQGCPASAPNLDPGHALPFVDGYLSGNVTLAEVGGFNAAVSTSGGVSTYTITNVAGQASFSGATTLGAGTVMGLSGASYLPGNQLLLPFQILAGAGVSDNPNGATGPRHNVTQTFTWQEPNPCKN